jgi:hypothetical protein
VEPLGSDALAHGQSTLVPFKTELKAALQAGMARGPVEALETCHIEAPRIASENSSDSVEIGRTSHRLRNPENAPRPWVEPILAAYLADPETLEPRAIRLTEDRMGYVEPIRIQAVCLTCHGESLAPAVAKEIRRLYPSDRATGFELGDFRGVFWAEMPIP